jgi:hypothetical protein
MVIALMRAEGDGFDGKGTTAGWPDLCRSPSVDRPMPKVDARCHALTPLSQESISHSSIGGGRHGKVARLVDNVRG